jgi:PKD repeat protein
MKDKKVAYLFSFIATITLFSCSKKDDNHSILYAFFKTDKTSVVAGDTVKFEDLSIGHPQAWKWTFEGGTPSSSTEENPSVIYDSSGKYQVSLVVTSGEKTYTKQIKNYITVVTSGQLNSDLVAFFPFNGNGGDVGPHHVDVINKGNVTFDGTDRNGDQNGAAVFDGKSALVVPDNPAFNFGTADYTISCWLKTAKTNKMMVWQESGANGSRDNQTWLRIGDNTTSKLLRFDTEDGGGGNILNYGSGPESGVGDGNWHNVICVREGGTTRLYIDGEKKGELIKSSAKMVSNSQDFKIGAQEGPIGTYKTYFTGLLDDLTIYNKALTDDEVAILYHD